MIEKTLATNELEEEHNLTWYAKDAILINKPREPNLIWHMAENLTFNMYVTPTWYNKLRWFIWSKLLIPGKVEWIKNERKPKFIRFKKLLKRIK